MIYPASGHFEPVPLDGVFNTKRSALPDGLTPPDDGTPGFGEQQFHGIPFLLGPPDADNVLLLEDQPVTVDLGGQRATYIVFIHAVQDRADLYQEGLADDVRSGRDLGDHVSDYRLEFTDGSGAEIPVFRRFGIQQSRIMWGSSAFAAVPLRQHEVFPTVTESINLGDPVDMVWGRGETRNSSGRDSGSDRLWIYAMPNPHPDQPLRGIVLQPRSERSVIYALSLTELIDHPLRPGTRRKLRLSLPKGAALNGIGELEDIGIDLGTVISARAQLIYDQERWEAGEPMVQPLVADNAVVVEYEAHPKARLHVGAGDDLLASYDLSELETGGSIKYVGTADKPVKVIVRERGGGPPVSVRLHIHGQAGEYLPPRGHHRKVNAFWFEDNYGEFVNGENQYSYVPGECVVDLPLGRIWVEITRGYEVQPWRGSAEVTSDTEELVFELDRVLRWREKGWVTADTHVHFLSPQTALLEGQAEGVNVVNLLASQWGEMFSNVGDFDGRTTLGASEFGGDGEFLVRVGTENRMQVLGHISLLGYSGEMIHPLCTGGPSESAAGDPQEVTMSQWARRCRDQNGLVVMPHAPDPQLERAADIVLGLVDAVEMMTFNPMQMRQINPYGVADWYRYLNLGYNVPVVGGSDKMAAASLLGGVRTYANLGDRELSYENWMAAVRSGDTFVTIGPLASMTVEDVRPGGQVHLPAGGGTVEVEWQVESVSVPIETVEVVSASLVADETTVGGKLSAAGHCRVAMTDSGWIALRVRGSCKGQTGEIAAHTSAVQIIVDKRPIFSERDAGLIMDQIEGAMAYVDTLAPRPEARRFRQLRIELEGAYSRLHQRMHAQGVFHKHTPLHDHDTPGEH